ncbi:hypothetical protein [Staphylococcus epidermidis]|nr:hypothetical protein [Staphylococcus epidermidis]
MFLSGEKSGFLFFMIGLIGFFRGNEGGSVWEVGCLRLDGKLLRVC